MSTSTKKEVLHYLFSLLLIDGQSKGQAGQFELFAKENKGMFRMGSVNCDSVPKVCQKENISKFPTWRVYPPYPVPVQDYESEKHDFDQLKKMASKFITSRVIEITANNHDTFIEENPGTPKILLFSDKKGTPLIYKALSSHFDVSFYQVLSVLENSSVRSCER